jgi:mannan endo-1,4-beta-mannosidase
VYDEKTLVGLDFAINEASKRGIRVVLVLANYWAMYGGIDQYNVWSFEAGSGAPPSSDEYYSLAGPHDQ